MCKGSNFWRHDHNFWRLFGDFFEKNGKLMKTSENEMSHINVS